MMQLRMALLSFDGKSTTILGEIAQRFRGTDTYPDHLIELFGDPDGPVSDGATWLLKNFVESGAKLSPAQVARFASSAAKLTTWAAQLHVCQSVRHITFSATDAERLGKWAIALLNHKRPFLRAWSLDALVVLARQAAALSAVAEGALADALEDDAASVRARARNLTRG